MVEIFLKREKVGGRVVQIFLHEGDHNYGADSIQESVQERTG